MDLHTLSAKYKYIKNLDGDTCTGVLLSHFHLHMRWICRYHSSLISTSFVINSKQLFV